MPFTIRDGVRLHWQQDGHADRPALLLLNSLGTEMSMWDAVVPLLTPAFRVLRMDTRGHGASDVPEGDYSIPMLAADALAVLDAVGVERAHVCGLSMGGMQVLHLAQSAPERLLKVVACNTSGEVPSDPWMQRAALVREKGVGAIADAIIGRFFSAPFRDRNPPRLETARAMFLAQSDQGYAACCAAIGGLAVAPGLPSIALPLLVINGALDDATPPEAHGDKIVAAVPGAQKAVLPAGHLSAIEVPAAFARAVLAFLSETGAALASARATLLDHGLGPRRAVLGDAWVEKAMAGRNSFSGEFQEFITRYAWGEIWSRPGLDQKTRRLLVLAITIALGRWEEFRLHVRAGLEQEGFDVEELKEVIMQTGIYAGVPGANTGFHHAEEILKSAGHL